MSVGTTSLCYNFLFFSIFMFVSADQKNITAVSGQDVSLPCRAPNNNIIVLEWRRAEHGANYVFLYQKGRFDPANQDPSFKNRVELRDRQMKDGDVSLILRNVNTGDTGKYKCGVFMRETRLWKNSIIYLTVVDPPEQKTITAVPGQNITLTCRAPNNNNIKSVHWSRSDLTDEYVFFYQKGQYVPDNQHPSFKNRVDLQDRQMKDGDVSLILKDVTINDTGTYECRVFIEETRSWKNSIIIYFTVAVPPVQENITRKSGQDVTLTCRALNDNITAVHWSRADLEDKYVLLHQKGQFDPANQHPSFKNRVDLKDRQMKDGDVSLILNNVTTADNGTYKCGVIESGSNSVTPICSIYLCVVDPPGQTGRQEKDEDNKDEGKEDKEKEDGSVGLTVGLTVSGVLLLVAAFGAVVGFFKCRKKKLNPADPHEAERLQPEYQKNITAESGQDVTLTCRAPNNNITGVKWTRPDLTTENVLLYQDSLFDPSNQHPHTKKC